MAGKAAKTSKRSRPARGSTGELTLGASKKGPQKRTGRPSDWTPAKAEKFIEVLADSCNVSLAARAVKRSVGNIYDQRSKDASFRARWDQALAIGYARLEMMMLERALHGVEKTVVTKTGESKIMREYNDRVALALLRHHRETALMADEATDEETHREACDRIIERLARLREQQERDGVAAPAGKLKLQALPRPLPEAGGEKDGVPHAGGKEDGVPHAGGEEDGIPHAGGEEDGLPQAGDA